MADLASLLSTLKQAKGPDSSASRGQIILITALALAVTFLALAVLINSAIFTENLATRNENVEPNQALEYRHSVEQLVGTIIEDTNHNHSDYDTIHENVSDGIRDASMYTAMQQIERENAVSVQLQDATEGTRIFQENVSTFESNLSADDWVLAEAIDNTRAFRINATNTDLTTDTFTVIANDTTTSERDWELRIDEDELVVERSDVADAERCQLGDTPNIDVTDATVDGEPCPALLDNEDGDPLYFAAGIDSPYNITFENGNDIEGTYSLVVDETDPGHADNYRLLDEPGDGPVNVDALYAATVSLEYETTKFEYETNVWVAPGEPGGQP